MRNFVLAATLAIGAIGLTIGSATGAMAASACPPQDLVVFGDSLSDPGNFPTGQTFTNGQPWAGQLGAGPFRDCGANFAFGGAQAVTNFDLSPDFDAQRALFRAVMPALGPDPLVVAWFGGNDLRNQTDPAMVPATVGAAIAAVGRGISDLAGLGLTRFILPNLPDLGEIPENAARPDAVRALVTRASRGFNAALEALAVAGRAQGLDMRVFDTAGLFRTILGDPAAYGFDAGKLTTPCGGGTGPCDGFLFWDGIHPTAAAHALIADGIGVLVQPAAVPVPAAGWLLLAGMGGLAAVGRRERRAA